MWWSAAYASHTLSMPSPAMMPANHSLSMSVCWVYLVHMSICLHWIMTTSGSCVHYSSFCYGHMLVRVCLRLPCCALPKSASCGVRRATCTMHRPRWPWRRIRSPDPPCRPSPSSTILASVHGRSPDSHLRVRWRPPASGPCSVRAQP